MTCSKVSTLYYNSYTGNLVKHGQKESEQVGGYGKEGGWREIGMPNLNQSSVQNAILSLENERTYLHVH